MSSSAFAPAKVNLYLHVGAPGADGFHPVNTLMVFASVGDEVSLSAPGGSGLCVTGPFATGLGSEENLVSRAFRRLSEQLHRKGPEPGLVLDKQLPIAAGLGGGSADAAAALRLLNQAWGGGLSDPELERLAAELGSDVPACIRSRPVIATGRGEVLAAAPELPDLPAVLVNPGVECPTGSVYRAYDLGVRLREPDRGPEPGILPDPPAVAGWLAGLRNDLESPAIAVAPEIGPMLTRLRAAPEVLLARLSGSGATAFALCRTTADAIRLADGLRREQPRWWVQACQLGAPLARDS